MDGTRLVREAMQARLAHSTTGFNALLQARATEYGVVPFSIDFTKPSHNFRMVFVDPQALRESGPIRLPLLTLYSTGINNEDLQKFHTFSGTVTMGLDVHYEHPQSVPFDTESTADLIDSVVKSVMNSTQNQHWGYEIVYGGQFGARRFPLIPSKKGWLQTLRYVFTFEVHEL